MTKKTMFTATASCTLFAVLVAIACALCMPQQALADGSQASSQLRASTAALQTQDDYYYQALSIKPVSTLKYTESLVMKPKLKKKLTATLNGTKLSMAKWSSTNRKVATVNKKGVVTAKKKGRCYIKAKAGASTAMVVVEVTSKKAYKAVHYAYVDKRTKIAYSQANRMDYSCRDCSSFVGRCFWDESLGRKVTCIGPEWAKSWALPAAEQAQWLNSMGRRVSFKACSIKKLRPGDTIYYETGYAGTNDRYRHIDHAALYIGNGYVMGTHGYGGKGEIGLQRYWEDDSTIRFIGRPCP